MKNNFSKYRPVVKPMARVVAHANAAVKWIKNPGNCIACKALKKITGRG